MSKPKYYSMQLKDGSTWKLAENGRVVWDGSRHRGPFGNDWRVIGFTRRHHSRDIISLARAAAGEPLGQGWVHDLDHGTHRMWGMPRLHRAISLREDNTNE